MMKKAPQSEKPNDSGRANPAAVAGVAMAGLGLTVALGTTYKAFSGESPAEQRQVQTLQAANKMYNGTLLIGSGAKFRKDIVVANPDKYGTPDNIRLIVGEGKTEILTQPVETTDDAGDLWVGMIPKGSNPGTDLHDVAHATGWANLTELRRQGLVKEVTPNAGTVTISITEKGTVQDPTSLEVFSGAMHSDEVGTAHLNEKLGELGLLQPDVPTSY